MMLTLASFIQQIIDSGLLTRAEVQTILVGRHPPLDTAEALADELVLRQRLTRFQVASIAQGKGRSLRLGVYEIQDFLGAGGMGHVYLAVHRRMRRQVALKVLPPQAMRDRGAVERFQREVQAAARLTHPNIVTAFDANEDRHVQYLVMEYVAGRDLAAIVREQGPLSVSLAVSCVIQVARGLEYAHAAGVIHRDIKPANLLLTSSGLVKILDMGLARAALPRAGSPRAELDESGVLLGTVDFVAPEQALDARRADARSDIYALGCTLYYLLTGRVRFAQKSLQEKWQAMQTQPTPSLRAARPEVSTALEAAYQRMVARAPRDRFQTAAQVLRALERLADRAQSGRFKTYADPALGDLVPAGSPAVRRASVRPGPWQLDPDYLQPLGEDEFGARPPQPARALPPLRRRRRWTLRVWLAVLGGAALIVAGTILVATEGCALF
jgi:serine/threonine protein kinase